MSRYLWSLAGLACLLLASGFMDSVDYFGYSWPVGFAGAGASIVGFAFCLKKGGFLND